MFAETESILKECLFTKLKANGQNEIDRNQPVAELIKPSIFDDEKVKELKASLLDVQEYILECKQLDEIQPQLDQMKKEAQEKADNGVDTSIPEGFGLPQKDAETFRPAPLIKKKRTIDQISKDPNADEKT